MVVNQFKIKGITLDEFVNFIIWKIEFKHENHSSDMSILIAEDTSISKEYHTCKTLIIKQLDNSLLIETIFSDGSFYLFEDLPKVESNFSLKVKKIIKRHEKELGIEFST